MAEEIHSVPDVIDKIGVTALAQALGHKNVSTVSSWKARKSIPVEHWPRIVELVGGVNYEKLVGLHAGNKAA